MRRIWIFITVMGFCLSVYAGGKVEDRGLYVSYDPAYGELGALVSWKWIAGDPENAAYDVYRSTDGGEFKKLNTKPISSSTNYKDTKVKVSKPNVYQLRFAGSDEVLAVYRFTPEMAKTFYRSIPLNMDSLPDSKGLPYQVSDAAVGDLDGDGKYEIVVKRQTKSIDNSKGGGSKAKKKEDAWTEGSALLEAYKLDGKFMWRVILGPNIRQGTHYIPFIVYDLDGDGKAELAVRTAERTIFGDGQEIGDVDGDGRTYYVNTNPDDRTYGKILEGPEFLSVIDGVTGAELARTDYIPRGDKSTWKAYWGDDYGNRIDRFLMAVGHFDSQHAAPSIVMCRGYYKNYQLVALDYAKGKLTERWHFNTYPDYQNYVGQGNHNLAVGDVDDDGKDEIVYGACCIDHNGKGLYSTGLGHGDALHLGKFDPERSRLQVVACHEQPRNYGDCGTEMRDAATGEILVRIPGKGDVGRCMVADVDADTPGCEIWSSDPKGNLYSCKGELLAKKAPVYKPGSAYSFNMGIWWSGSLNRQILDKGYVQSYTEGRIFTAGEYQAVTAHGTKANPCLYADLWGDWREEMIYRTEDNKELRIFTTNIETEYRFRPLMNDPIYHMSVVHQNVGYNQPTHTGFYLGSDLEKSKK